MFMLDTNVVSEMRKIARGTCDAAVAAWLQRAAPSELYLSVVSVLELEIGYGRLLRRDARQAQLLKAWLSDAVYPLFAERILSIDVEIAQICASLHVPDKRPENDALIAATAMRHDLTVVTRNTADFKAISVSLLNPWSTAST